MYPSFRDFDPSPCASIMAALMSTPIFISFASKDLSVARTICEALENRGFHCWISSRDIGPGENFQVAIVRAIRLAKAMILVFSGNSNISEEVKKELVLAGQNRLIVIPVRVEDVAPDEAFAYEFATRQWIDAFHDWEHAIQRIVDQLRQVQGFAETPEGAPPRAAASWPESPQPAHAADTGTVSSPAISRNDAPKSRAGGWRWIAFPAFGLAAVLLAVFVALGLSNRNSSPDKPAIAEKPGSAPAALPTPVTRDTATLAANPPPRVSATPNAPVTQREAATPPAKPVETGTPGSFSNPRIADIGIATQQKTPGSDLLGVWGGSSSCSQGEIGVELSLKELQADGAVSGSLRFFNLPGQNNTADGEYTLGGRYYDKDRTLYLQPGNWIKQPPGYSMANFTLTFYSGEQALKGRVANVACSTISVTRNGGTASPPSTAPRPSG